MDRLRVYLNNAIDALVHPRSGTEATLIGLRTPFDSIESAPTAHTDLDRTTYPPSLLRSSFLRQADEALQIFTIKNVQRETRQTSAKKECTCGQCRTYVQKPCHFKFTV